MAGRGPAPKETRSRARDQRTREESLTVVTADGTLHGPELPESCQWPTATLAWWETWRASAQAKTFTDTDWSFLLDTALLHAMFWGGDYSVAAELRLRAAKFGATPEDRARLKIEIGQPAAKAQPAKTRSTAARKARLLQVVNASDEA